MGSANSCKMGQGSKLDQIVRERQEVRGERNRSWNDKEWMKPEIQSRYRVQFKCIAN